MLKIKGLSSGYSDRYVLTDVSVEIEQNSFVGIIGKNGSGKSTLLKTLAGLIPKYEGEVFYNDVNILKDKAFEIVSYVPQEAPLLFGFSVNEILKMSQRSYKRLFATLTYEEKRNLDEVIERFELKDILNRSILSLSGGEKRRVLVARGVAQNSRVLLLDEPLSGLDIDHQVKVFDILKDVARNGRIVIASVHDLNMAAQFCDKIMLLSQGRLNRYGAIEDVLNYGLIKNVFGVDVYVGVNEINNKRFLIPFK